MNVEKEYRYKVTDKNIKLIISLSTQVHPEQTVTDLVMGYNGFDSLFELGYICRIRQQNDKTVIECKKKNSDETWVEEEIQIESIAKGYSFLSLMGLKPYLLIERKREERETPDFKICIDDISLLGKFVEIEFKNVDDLIAEETLSNFKRSVKILDIPQKLYGDIFKERLTYDVSFKQKFESRLNKIIQSQIPPAKP
jgi:predicted adenylyl cyclase CyaB